MDRRRRHEETAGRVQLSHKDAVQWSREYDEAPNVIVELVDSSGIRRAHVKGDGEDWLVVVGDLAAGGSDDVFVALGLLLGISLESELQGTALRFSPWLIEEVDKRCEAMGADYETLLCSLLAPAYRAYELPSIGLCSTGLRFPVQRDHLLGDKLLPSSVGRRWALVSVASPVMSFRRCRTLPTGPYGWAGLPRRSALA